METVRTTGEYIGSFQIYFLSVIKFGANKMETGGKRTTRKKKANVSSLSSAAFDFSKLANQRRRHCNCDALIG